jgi:acetyltransferase-like isoleucine patch superfamily enzyme
VSGNIWLVRHIKRVLRKGFLWRNSFRAHLRGVSISSPVLIGSCCRFRLGHGGDIAIGTHSELQHGVVLDAYGGSIRLGLNVFLGPYVVVYGHGGIEIGDQTLISMHCRILSSNHAIPPSGVDIRSQSDVLLPTRIGRDVWLGAGVTVLGGVSIGDGCIVGAGSVVSKDLPPNAVAFGVPATIRYFRAGITSDATGG